MEISSAEGSKTHHDSIGLGRVLPVGMLSGVAIVKGLASFIDKYVFRAEVIVDRINACGDLGKLAGDEAGGFHTVPVLKKLAHRLYTLCALRFMSRSIINKTIDDMASYRPVTDRMPSPHHRHLPRDLAVHFTRLADLDFCLLLRYDDPGVIQ